MMIPGGSRRRERGVDSFSSNLSRETGFTETRRWRKLILMNVLRNRVALRRAEFSKSFGGRQRIFKFFLSTCWGVQFVQRSEWNAFHQLIPKPNTMA